MLPNARTEGLLAQEIGDEVIVYDQETHKVHRLNQSARLVWQHCDGKQSITDLAQMLNREVNLPADEEVVWLALDRLDKARLLQERLTRPTESGGVSRRQVLRKLAYIGGLAVLLPVVEGIVAPTPAMAASNGGCGKSCSSNADCQNNRDCKICHNGGGTGTNKTCRTS